MGVPKQFKCNRTLHHYPRFGIYPMSVTQRYESGETCGAVQPSHVKFTPISND